jgi:magnesium chelatase subunit D
MDDAIRALTCLMVDPELHGLLIKGPAGSGKSALIHSFSRAYSGRRAKVVPQNITDEQLFGSIDLEQALTTGKMVFEPGLLGEEGGIVLVDDINLLPRNTSLTLMDSVHRGSVHVEREGMSVAYPCSVSIVATANDREQPLGSAIADLFDMCVVVPRDPDQQKRIEVMRSVLSDDCEEFGRDEELVARIERASEILGDIKIQDDALQVIVETCDKYGVQGMRGGLSTARVSRASAALNGHTKIEEEDVSFALRVCIPHRRTRVRRDTKEEPEDKVQFFGDSHMKRFIHDERKELLKDAEESEGEAQAAPAATGPSIFESKGTEDPDEKLVMDMEKLFDTIDLLDDSRKKKGQADSHLMRRFIKDAGKDGRYVSSCPAQNSTVDLAVDATVRYAAPYQNQRREITGRDKGVIILPSDLRQKVREKHTSCLFFFMVDNSGSLVLRARMRAVKAAIMSMLADHYVRKDSVAVMTFNEEFIGMLLPPTRSVGGVKKVIDEIPTGKKTPLSEALSYMHQYVGQYLRKRPSDVAFVVLMTDAGANMAMNDEKDPFEEAIEIASHLRLERMECVLVDTKVSNEPNEKARRLSYALEAPYYKIEDLRSSDNIIRK